MFSRVGHFQVKGSRTGTPRVQFPLGSGNEAGGGLGWRSGGSGSYEWEPERQNDRRSYLVHKRLERNDNMRKQCGQISDAFKARTAQLS